MSDFPLLVRLDSSRIDYSQCSPNGLDVSFRADDGTTPLAYEMESWNPNGSSCFWVKVPSITSTSSYIWLYYSEVNPVDGSDPPAVWSNGYVGVWHGGLDPATGLFRDSTGKHGGSSPAPFSAPSSTTAVGGIGNVFNYIAQKNGIVVPNAADIADLPSLSLELRIYDNGSVGGETLWEKGPLGVSILAGHQMSFTAGFSSGSLLASGPSLWGVGSWETVALTWDGSATGAGFLFYSHGTPLAPTSTTGGSGSRTSDAANRLILGNTDNPPRKGAPPAYLDEIRLSNVPRSAPWMMAQYRSQGDLSLTFGAPEDVPH